MFKVYWDLYRQLYHKFTAEFELKKFEHRSLFGEVMERSIVAAFFDSMAGTNGAVFCTTLYKLYTVCVRNKTWLLVNFLLASESRCRNSKVHFLKDLINEEKILCVISSDHAATYCQKFHTNDYLGWRWHMANPRSCWATWWKTEVTWTQNKKLKTQQAGELKSHTHAGNRRRQEREDHPINNPQTTDLHVCDLYLCAWTTMGFVSVTIMLPTLTAIGRVSTRACDSVKCPGNVPLGIAIIHSLFAITTMWANAQRDGLPAKYRWRPLFNATKCGWCTILECRAVTLPGHETRWNLQGCPKLANRSQPLLGRSSPHYDDIWRRYCCLTSFFCNCRYMP